MEKKDYKSWGSRADKNCRSYANGPTGTESGGTPTNTGGSSTRTKRASGISKSGDICASGSSRIIDVNTASNDKLYIMFSNVDTFNVAKQLELSERLKVMENTPQVIALQEVKPKICKVS